MTGDPERARLMFGQSKTRKNRKRQTLWYIWEVKTASDLQNNWRKKHGGTRPLVKGKADERGFSAGGNRVTKRVFAKVVQVNRDADKHRGGEGHGKRGRGSPPRSNVGSKPVE